MDYSTPPFWTNQPHTNKYAKPKLPSHHVTKATVIVVKNAFYRNAVFDGIFLISPNKIPPLVKAKERVEVECRWFDARLKTRGIRILVDNTNGNAVIDYDYTGDVVCNLAV